MLLKFSKSQRKLR